MQPSSWESRGSWTQRVSLLDCLSPPRVLQILVSRPLPLLPSTDVDVQSPDEKSVITYVSTLYDAFPKVPEGADGISPNVSGGFIHLLALFTLPC